MTIKETHEYQIRNYSEQDASIIGRFDLLLELSYRYNPDFVPANIFCAVNPAGDILGVGHLEPHDTWNLIDKGTESSDFIYKLVLCVSLNTGIEQPTGLKADLLKSLLNRAKEIRSGYPDKKIRAFLWLNSDNHKDMDFFLSHGFAAYHNSLVLKYDLSQEIPDVPKPEGISVVQKKMDSEEELLKYHKAESIAFSGAVWSLNHVRWLKNGPEWADFCAFYGNELVGNTMTWMITEERSATEDIFVLPGYRNKGVARYLITETLKYLKNQGKSIATLSVYGDNKPAISLYTSLGYIMYGIMIEFGYDL